MENGTEITGNGPSVWIENWHEGRYYCFCGAMLEITDEPWIVAGMKRLFWSRHDGPGHGICDRSTCERARLQSELSMTLEDY